MISFLCGNLASKTPPFLVLDVNGVGYEIEAPMTTFYHLPEIGKKIQLHTHLIIREDAHNLYGFIDESDKTLFKTLIKISGVGAKLALTILSGQGAEEFCVSIQKNDIQALVRLPGVGKKTAERLVIELRDKLPKLPEITAVKNLNNAKEDAISALCSLGYKPLEANRMVQSIESDGKTCEMIIKLALQNALKT